VTGTSDLPYVLVIALVVLAAILAQFSRHLGAPSTAPVPGSVLGEGGG